MKKSQTAIEASILIGFMSFTLIAFLAFTYQQSLDLQAKGDKQLLEDTLSVVESEIELAVTSSDGYYREYQLPETVSGRPYSIKFISADITKANFSELEIRYLNKTITDNILLPKNVFGTVCKGKNIVSRNKGIINITCIQCSNKEDDDGNGCADYPADKGCISLNDPIESGGPCATECSDNTDNDGNGCADFPRDSGCTFDLDTTENGGVCRCTDGTPYGSCSTDFPRYCEGGTLIDACGPPQQCGCDPGLHCQNNLCSP